MWEAFRSALTHLRDNPSVITEHIRKLEQQYRTGYAEEIEGLEERLRSIELQLADLDAARNRLDVSHADRITRQNELKVQQVETRRELDCFRDNRIEQSRELLSLLHSLGGSFVLHAPASAGEEELGECCDCNEPEGGGDPVDREELFRSMIANVTVYGRERFGFHFPCGLIVTADLAAPTTNYNAE